MKKLFLIYIFIALFVSCNTIKYVKENEQLLTKNVVYVDSVKTSTEAINELLLQKPNAKALGMPLSLYFYNLGNPNGAKTPTEWGKKHPKLYEFYKKTFSEKQAIAVSKTFIGLNKWFIDGGQAPVVISNKKVKGTVDNLKAYFQNEGYFKARVSAKQDSVGRKKGMVTYTVAKGKAMFLDSIRLEVKSPVLDSLYSLHKNNIKIVKGSQYKDANFVKEAERVAKLFRNNGVYHFDKNASIDFYIEDTVNYKTNVDYIIDNRLVEKDGSYIEKPYQIQKIKRINVHTDYTFTRKDEAYKDTVSYNGVNFFAFDELKYNPKLLSQSLFLKANGVYSDSLRNLTRTHLRNLKNFKSTSIRFSEIDDKNLEANIYLTPIEKYTLGIQTELSRSNIRTFDVSAEFSLINRNTFRGGEIFKISASGAYFNSNNGLGWEIGGNTSLEIPRFLAPFGLNKMVPKQMFPRTQMFAGINIQRNIGLDRQNITVGLNYKWQYNRQKSIQLDIFNSQYIRNLNVSNYFGVYTSEYRKLAVIDDANTNYTLPDNSQSNSDAIISFMRNVALDADFAVSNPTEYQDNINILNRYNIITSDFLIPEIAYTFTYNNQETPKDANFSYFRVRIANSGNIMGLISDSTNDIGNKTVFKLPIAQYFKTDIEYKKYWSLGDNAVLAHRTFLGAIFTYDNSDIPFSRSYFAGGSNDIRAWRTYDLGPGATPPGLEYNIGSFKFLSSLEYRFDLFGSLKGALFVDAGNIWDITNSNFLDDEAKLKSFSSLSNIAVGTGLGLRYDFKFLIARFDLGFKTHEPYLQGNKWFQNFSFPSSVFNLGINYPF